MNKLFRFVVLILLSMVLIISAVLPAFAAEWNGSTADGGVGNSSIVTGGYAVMPEWAVDGSGPDTVMALRFSFYNVDIGVTKGTTIDIYRSKYADYMGWNKLSTKYNKLQLRKLYNSDSLNTGFSTRTTNCYTENDADLVVSGLTNGLPDYTSELAEWQKNSDNINAILAMMSVPGVGNDKQFKTGDYLLVEPLFPITVDWTYNFSLTVTEMAILGSDGNINGIGDWYDGTQTGYYQEQLVFSWNLQGYRRKFKRFQEKTLDR